MTVVIRMKRTGRRNRPCYRISVADQRAPRDGATLENLGLYDPIAAKPEAQLSLNVERAKHWIAAGAQPSETVRSIFKRNGVFEDAPPKKKRDRSGRKAKTKTGEHRVAAKQARAELKAARPKRKAKKAVAKA
jgi:small subunit ribosomal protein S16